MKRLLRRCLLLVAMFAMAGIAQAQRVIIVEVDPLPCVPRQGNAVVTATVTPDEPENAVRLFFQRDAYGELYYLEMMPLGAGRYWAVLPKPEEQNDVAEYHVNVVAPGPADIDALENRDYQSSITLQSSPTHRTPVTDDCKVEMTEEQRNHAQRLRVGETTVSQKGRPVAWWMCDGIIERIDTKGGVRPDEFCGAPPAPVPIIVEGKGIPISPTPPPEVSPSRP